MSEEFEKQNKSDLISTILDQRSLLSQQKQALVTQKEITNRRVRQLNLAEDELRGAKYVISLLVERLGGTVKVTAVDHAEHEFSLTTSYDPATETTIFTNR